MPREVPPPEPYDPVGEKVAAEIARKKAIAKAKKSNPKIAERLNRPSRRAGHERGRHDWF